VIDVRVETTMDSAVRAQRLHLEVHLRASTGITAIYGPHDSGKTLLFECIAGLHRPDRGRILVRDRILFDADSGVSLAVGTRQVGIVLERNCLLPHLTLRENLAFAASRMPAREATQRVSEILDRFSLGDVADRVPRFLDPAEHRVGMIAQALIRRPDVLMVDAVPEEWEPSLRLQLFSLLREVATRDNVTILLATRRLDDCFEAADSMVILRDGKVAQDGTPSEVATKPASVAVAEMLGTHLLIPAEIAFLDPQNKLSRLKVFGTEIPGPYFAGHFKGSKLMLCVAPSRVDCSPRNGNIAFPGHLPLVLRRAVVRAHDVRLYFEEGLVVDLPEVPPQSMQAGSRWQMGIPPSAMRAL
jgi:molybdate transport system ATP-binding protein